MGLIKEPKNVDLSTKSEPWTKQELADFRKAKLSDVDKPADEVNASWWEKNRKRFNK